MSDNGHRPREVGFDDGAAALSYQARAHDEFGILASPEAGLYFNLFQRGAKPYDVPPWGYVNRDRQLRVLWRTAGAEPVQAAISSDIQKTQSTPWTLEGPKRVAKQVHAMLHNADFGQGWEQFLARIILDYRTQDNGLFVEVIGDGPPLLDEQGQPLRTLDGDVIIDTSAPLEGPVLGIAHIDSARCVRTGDVDYPVVYWGINGVRHKLHATRVIFAADMPATEERRYGMGFCALSRCIAAAQSLIMWSEMRNEMMDDMPPLGILTFNNINKAAFDAQYKAYMATATEKGQDIYRGLLTLFNVGAPIEPKLLNFRQVELGFDQKIFYDTMIDLVAMAFNMDRQELAQLSTESLGSGGQSKAMNHAARGKGVHNLLGIIERMINRITPQSVTFRFDYQDVTEELERAQVNQMKMNMILSMYTAKQPDSNVSINAVSQTTPAINTPVAEGVIDREEARYLLIKEGVLPRELMTPEDNLRPDWERFDDVTVKALRRFGPRVVIDQLGNARAYRRPTSYLGASYAA